MCFPRFLVLKQNRFFLEILCLTIIPYVRIGKHENNIRIYHDCEGGIEKSFPRITDWHHEACRVKTVGGREGRIFLSHPHTNIRFVFFCSPLNTSFILDKTRKTFQKILNTLRCDMEASFLHYSDVMDQRTASMRLLVYYLSLWLVRVCEIEISHMGKTTEIRIWCSRNLVFNII